MEFFYKQALTVGLIVTAFSSITALVSFTSACKLETSCAEDRTYARLYRLEHGIKTEEESRVEQLQGQRAEEVKH